MKTIVKQPTRTLRTADLIRPDVWRERLAPLMTLPDGATLEAVSILRVYPSRPEGFGVQAELSLRNSDGATLSGDVFLTSGLKSNSSTKRQLRSRRGCPLGFTGLLIPVDGGVFTLHTPDYDDALPGISDAIRPASFSNKLRATAGEVRPAAKRWKCTLGNYRPRRRCTLLYRATSGTTGAFFVAKLFRRDQAEKQAEKSRQLVEALEHASDGGVVAPHVIDVWKNWNAIVFEGLHGSASHDPGQLLPAERARPAAAILSRLHSAVVGGLPEFTPADELHATGRWVELAARLGRLRPAAERLWETLRRSAPRVDARRQCTIHRDFHASQILPMADRWGIVDFDTAARGDPEQDVANFIGHTIWESVQDGGRRAEWISGSATLIDEYQRARGRVRRVSLGRFRLSPARIRFYLMSSLLRVGIIHSLRTGAERRALLLHRIAAESLDDVLNGNQIERRLRRAV